MTQAIATQAARPSFARRSWPMAVALVAIVLGLALVAAAAYLRKERLAALAGAQSLQAELARASARARSAPAAGPSAGPDLPLYASHLADVEKLIRTSADQSVRLGALQFRTDRVEKLPYVVRVAEFRVEEDYPRLKAFVAELLRRLPHAYLDELRVDQGGDVKGKVQATLRLSFVYQAVVPQEAETFRAGGTP